MKIGKLPPDRLSLLEAVAKYKGFTWDSLKRAIERKRLNAFKSCGTWYTTDRAMKKYIETRDEKKIPKTYRKKLGKALTQ
ncbi:MAG: hypothetical protein HY582_03805 [Candidatus Omnitrophica bacterium]|nr:hypothetical protein [Candidatus Omnitrophota bacterium]